MYSLNTVYQHHCYTRIQCSIDEYCIMVSIYAMLHHNVLQLLCYEGNSMMIITATVTSKLRGYGEITCKHDMALRVWMCGYCYVCISLYIKCVNHASVTNHSDDEQQRNRSRQGTRLTAYSWATIHLTALQPPIFNIWAWCLSKIANMLLYKRQSNDVFRIRFHWFEGKIDN